MDTLSPHKNSKQSSSSSSGCSASSSTTDIKNSYKTQRLDNKPAGLRSRSFLHCLSKHLGRHFIHHHQPHHHHHHHHTVHQNGQTIVYNSQEELRSSSTDSFSLSNERNSRLDSLMQQNHSNCTGTSSFDISSEERTSRASSTSACSRFSPEQDDLENGGHKVFNGISKQHHIYISTTIYRPTSSLDCHDDLEEDFSESDSGNSSSDENEVQNQENIFNQNLNNNNNNSNNNNSKSKSTPNSVVNTPLTNLTTTSAKGLHLSRISITSSVRSIFQHISAVSASSTRSLSCSSTPLKRVWDSKCKKSNSSPVTTTTSSSSGKTNKSSTRFSNSNSQSSANSTTSSSCSSTSASSSSSSSATSACNNKKAEKKQQSILRPPINYVYMKGMSGLYSRVPRYSVCCPYGTQQWA